MSNLFFVSGLSFPDFGSTITCNLSIFFSASFNESSVEFLNLYVLPVVMNLNTSCYIILISFLYQKNCQTLTPPIPLFVR